MHDDVRDYNKQKFQLQEMYNTPFDDWIEHYYDMEDCQKLMEEERTEMAEQQKNQSNGKKGPKKLPKSVNECLDGLSALIHEFDGQLPIDCPSDDDWAGFSKGDPWKGRGHRAWMMKDANWLVEKVKIIW